jgi:hypothetical protein
MRPYHQICQAATLRRAYAELGRTAEVGELGEVGSVQRVLEQLAEDLTRGRYQPSSRASATQSARNRSAQLRDQVVQSAVKLVLDRFFAPALPCSPEPAQAIKWATAAVGGGLTRAYAVKLDRLLWSGRADLLLPVVRRRIDDAPFLELLETIVGGLRAEHEGEHWPLPAMLLNVALHGVDEMLKQARGLGRDQGAEPVASARFGDELVVLASSAPHYHWVLPAVQERLQGELARHKLRIDPSDCQTADLARGDKLLLLGYELSYGPDKDGTRRARYQPLAKPAPVKAEVPVAEPEVQRTQRGRRGLAAGLPRALGPGRSVYAVLGGMVLLLALSVVLFRPRGEGDLVRHEVFTRPSGGRAAYEVYVPPNHEAGRLLPLILYLSPLNRLGTGGVSTQRYPGMSLAIEVGVGRSEPLPFVVLFVDGESWEAGSDESRLAMELVDHACVQYSVDPERVALTGLSEQGVWNLAAAYPERWSAIVPLSAFRGSVPAARVAQIPCWCFHGEANAIERARAQIEALQDAGGRPRLTEVPAIGATVWNQAFLNRDLYQWLAQQRRERK